MRTHLVLLLGLSVGGAHAATTELISRTTSGVAANGSAFDITPDGRFVLFASGSSNVGPNDTNK
jgi:hypothetical protein